jgi:hypothetical protein
MYFDTDILLKYSDPTTASGSYFSWIYHQWKGKYLLHGLQKMNIAPDLDQTTEPSWQEDWWRKKKSIINTLATA